MDRLDLAIELTKLELIEFEHLCDLEDVSTEQRVMIIEDVFGASARRTYDA